VNKELLARFGGIRTSSSARFEFGLGFDFVAAAFRRANCFASFFVAKTIPSVHRPLPLERMI
jgi:hypothetical protein